MAAQKSKKIKVIIAGEEIHTTSDKLVSANLKDVYDIMKQTGNSSVSQKMPNTYNGGTVEIKIEYL